MKTTAITIVAVLFATLAIQAQKSMDKFTVQVDGLGCPFCAYGLEKKFKEFKGIKDVKIDIETGNFSFTYPSEKELSMADVENQVEKAGYTPVTTTIERADGTVQESGGSATPMNADAKMTEKSVKVSGNCEQCRARIEKAAKDVAGVQQASWDKDSKLLVVQLDGNVTSLEAVERAVAEVGHDTENHKAHADDYGSLPACCQYERITQ
ncbi:MAG TPA: heavy-metal-associated domain-containing protein [Pricia sp.]|nr:heavy-metal-associated domain-containing protein [Pricia sp.]